MLRMGGKKVKTTKQSPITQRTTKESFSVLQLVSGEENLRVSYTKTMAAQIKNMAMFIKSGDFPIIPL